VADDPQPASFYLATQRTLLIAVGLLLLANLANAGLPLVLKEVVDALARQQQEMIDIGGLILVAYVYVRLSKSMFSALPDALISTGTSLPFIIYTLLGTEWQMPFYRAMKGGVENQ
jgi:ABC-type multidrug transport system fused ATPase/permease subunit